MPVYFKKCSEFILIKIILRINFFVQADVERTLACRQASKEPRIKISNWMVK